MTAPPLRNANSGSSLVGPPLLRTSLRSLAEAKAAESRTTVWQVESVEQLLRLKGTGRFSRDNVPRDWDSGYRPGTSSTCVPVTRLYAALIIMNHVAPDACMYVGWGPLICPAKSIHAQKQSLFPLSTT